VPADRNLIKCIPWLRYVSRGRNNERAAPHRNESGIKYDTYISACREHASAESADRSECARKLARGDRSIQRERERERERERVLLNATARSYDALVRETIARLIFMPGVNRRKCHVRARTSAVRILYQVIRIDRLRPINYRRAIMMHASRALTESATPSRNFSSDVAKHAEYSDTS
jgi:hypothetical protein